jgi:copper chaperone CopZ
MMVVLNASNGMSGSLARSSSCVGPRFRFFAFARKTVLAGTLSIPEMPDLRLAARPIVSMVLLPLFSIPASTLPAHVNKRSAFISAVLENSHRSTSNAAVYRNPQRMCSRLSMSARRGISIRGGALEDTGPSSKEIRLLVGGMHCAGCAGRVEKLLAAVPGVQKVCTTTSLSHEHVFRQLNTEFTYDSRQRSALR